MFLLKKMPTRVFFCFSAYRRNIFWARLAFYFILINKNEIKCILKDKTLKNCVLSSFYHLV